MLPTKHTAPKGSPVQEGHPMPGAGRPDGGGGCWQPRSGELLEELSVKLPSPQRRSQATCENETKAYKSCRYLRR